MANSDIGLECWYSYKEKRDVVLCFGNVGVVGDCEGSPFFDRARRYAACAISLAVGYITLI